MRVIGLTSRGTHLKLICPVQRERSKNICQMNFIHWDGSRGEVTPTTNLRLFGVERTVRRITNISGRHRRYNNNRPNTKKSRQRRRGLTKPNVRRRQSRHYPRPVMTNLGRRGARHYTWGRMTRRRQRQLLRHGTRDHTFIVFRGFLSTCVGYTRQLCRLLQGGRK